MLTGNHYSAQYSTPSKSQRRSS